MMPKTTLAEVVAEVAAEDLVVEAVDLVAEVVDLVAEAQTMTDLALTALVVALAGKCVKVVGVEAGAGVVGEGARQALPMHVSNAARCGMNEIK